MSDKISEDESVSKKQASLSKEEKKLEARIAQTHEEIDRMFVFAAKLYKGDKYNPIVKELETTRARLAAALAKYKNKRKTGVLA